jgi:hypothetical protein
LGQKAKALKVHPGLKLDDLDVPIPDHGSLSNICDRYGLDIFQQFFEHIVQLCIDAGLIWGVEFEQKLSTF